MESTNVKTNDQIGTKGVIPFLSVILIFHPNQLLLNLSYCYLCQANRIKVQRVTLYVLYLMLRY